MLVRIKVLGWSIGGGAEPETEGEWPERAEPRLGVWTWWKGTKSGYKNYYYLSECKITNLNRRKYKDYKLLHYTSITGIKPEITDFFFLPTQHCHYYYSVSWYCKLVRTQLHIYTLSRYRVTLAFTLGAFCDHLQSNFHSFRSGSVSSNSSEKYLAP